MGEVTTSPREIALLVAVPTDERSFRAAWRRGSSYLCRVYKHPDLGWEAYKQTANLARDELKQCEDLGATIFLEATIKNFATLVQSFKVVVVIAHMEFPPVSINDVVDADKFLSLVDDGLAPEWQMIRAECVRPLEIGKVIAVINELFRRNHQSLVAAPTKDFGKPRRAAEAQSGEGPSSGSKSFGLLRLDRPRLDEICGSTVLSEGKGIEFADGMASAREFVEAIPPDHDGLIDLRMCNSISVGAAIRRSGKSVRAAVGKRETYPDAAVLLQKTVYFYMVEEAKRGRPVSYEDAMLLLGEVLS